MAQPARNLDDQNQDSIYDKPGAAPSSPKPNLRSLEGGGEGGGPKSSGLYDANKDLGASSLAEREANSATAGDPAAARHENKLGDGYKKSSGPPNPLNFLSKRKNPWLLAGGLASSIIILSVVAFLLLIPAKILHIVNNLEHHFYATSQNAVEKETDRLFSNYIKRALWSQSCGKQVVSASCTPYNPSDNIVERLYNGWRKGKLEDHLAKDYGLKFYKVGSTFYMDFPGGSGVGIDKFLNSDMSLQEFLSSDANIKGLSRNEVIDRVDAALSGETYYKKVLIRKQAARYLERYYRIKLCEVGCLGLDKVINDKRDLVEAKKKAFKILLAQRILQPRSEMLGFVVQCALLGDQCPWLTGETDYQPTDHEATDSGCKKGCDLNGRPYATLDTEVDTKLEELAAKYLDSAAALEAYKLVAKDGTKGLFDYVIKSAFRSFADAGGSKETQGKLGTDAGKLVADHVGVSAVPGIGEINAAFNLVYFVDKSPEFLQKMTYLMNAESMVAMATMYSTTAGEIKDGHMKDGKTPIDAAVIGAMTDALGPGNQNVDGNPDPQSGGTADATGTPLYNSIVEGGTGQGSKDYLCDNGKPPDTSKSLTCSEMHLNQAGWFAQSVGVVKGLPGWSELAAAAGWWKTGKDLLFGTITQVAKYLICGPFGIICNAISWIFDQVGIKDGVNAVASAVSTYLGKIIGPFLKTIIGLLGYTVNLVGMNPSGGRTVDLAMGGFDISANSYAHNGLGGVALTPGQVADNLNYYKDQQTAHLQNESVIARMFDQDNNNSISNKVAMALPTNPRMALNSTVANITANPLGKILGRFNTIFGLHKASAATVGVDPFDVTQYGYPLDDPVFNQDPEQYWAKNCVTSPDEVNSPDLTYKWNQYAGQQASPNTNYMPENTQTSTLGADNKYGTNGCLLIQSAIESSGAMFTDDVIPADDVSYTVSPDGKIADKAPAPQGSQEVAAVKPKLAKNILRKNTTALKASLSFGQKAITNQYAAIPGLSTLDIAFYDIRNRHLWDLMGAS